VAGEEERGPASAHRQAVKSLELGDAMRVSRLGRYPGEQAEARALPTPIYGLVHQGL
jgi:hypothetical protein